MTSRRHQTLTDVVLAGRWRFRRTIGTGAEGTVYQATDVDSGEPVAVKVFDNENPDDPHAVDRRLDAETRLARAIRSRWLVRVLEAGVLESESGHRTPWVVMEYLQGQTLRAALSFEGRVRQPANVWMRTARQIVDTVAMLHANGWLHLDLKPENIFMLDEPVDGRLLKLIDLSSARRVDDDRPYTPRGTPLYVAPEVILRQGEPTQPADVYSLGVVLYELFVGRPPITDLDPTAIVTRHAHGQLDAWPKDVGAPYRLSSIYRRATAREPWHRYADAKALADALARQ